MVPMSWSECGGLWADVSPGDDGSATVWLAGEFDIASAGTAYRAVGQLGAGTRRIVLDLSRVTFFGACGLRFLLAVRARASAAGSELVVRHPSRAVRRIVELTGTAPLLSPVSRQLSAACG
jgi:anti-sigma B factor antagonist